MSALEILVRDDPKDQVLRDAKRIGSVIEVTEQHYKQHRAPEDVRNLSYYRGNFWKGDGFSQRVIDQETNTYAAQDNLVFPMVDTIVSSLAMDLPQVEAFDQRYSTNEIPTRDNDLTIAGRRLAAVLNYWAEADELDVAVREWILHAELFGYGVLKTSWSPILKRPIWRTRLPWEWQCDPSAKRMSEANWCFERFVLHRDDFQDRVDQGVYDLFTKNIPADTYPRSLVDEQMGDDEEQRLRNDGLREYVGMVEFWDFRRKQHIHFHPGTKQIVYMGELPYGRPYDVLVFHDSVGRVRGVSDVSLIAPAQKDTNIMMSARRETAFRLQQRVVFDRGLFQEGEFERIKAAKPWEWQVADFPNDGPIDNKVWTSPPANMSFDFTKHLDDLRESSRNTPGLGDFQRGEVKNIRTAAEATMVRSSVEGRLNIRVKKVVRAVSSAFKRAEEVWRWALDNQEDSGLDMEELASLTQADIGGEQLANDLVSGSPRFRLLPFSPLMEDKFQRREQLSALLQTLGPSPLMQFFNGFEMAREVVELYGFRPSCIQEPPPPPPPGLDVNQAPVAGMPPQLPGQAPEVPQDPTLPPVIQTPGQM